MKSRNQKTIDKKKGENYNIPKRGYVEVEEMGMTNEQYKGFLLNELEDWQEILETAREEGAEKTVQKAEKQINKINEMMKF